MKLLKHIKLYNNDIKFYKSNKSNKKYMSIINDK